MDDYNIFNIFKVLKLDRKETIHSAMIAAIVSHDSKSRDAFFKMLKGKAFGERIQLLIDSIKFDDKSEGQWIDTEVNLKETVNRNGKQVSVDRGRADIWIGTNDKKAKEQYRLIIENKIDADFQYRQLRRYYRYLTDKNSREFAGLFVLCVNDDKEFVDKVHEAAKEFNKESKIFDDNNKKTRYSIITYKDIISWLEEVIRDTEEGDFKTAVIQYKEIIKGFYPETKE